MQSPSDRSASRFNATIADDDEFRETWQFTWAFNVKPDLVTSGKVLCMESMRSLPALVGHDDAAGSG